MNAAHAHDFESLVVHFRRTESIRKESLDYPSLDLDQRQLADLEMLLNRAFYPLSGYLTRDDYESVLETMRLADGQLWPMPVCLDVDEETARSISQGDLLALRDMEGFMQGLLEVGDIWRPDKRAEAQAVYGTADELHHPGVRRLYQEVRDVYVGGRLIGLSHIEHYDYPELRLAPMDVFRQAAIRGWRSMTGLQVDRRLHRGLREAAMEAVDEQGGGVLLQPALGHARPNDRGHFTTVRCYQQFAADFPSHKMMLNFMPLAPRQAGPREALWETMIFKNYSCDHAMLSENQAAPEGLYAPWAGYELAHEHEEETGCKPLRLEPRSWSASDGGYVCGEETCADACEVSGKELERLLLGDGEIPDWLCCPSVADELRKLYPPRDNQGFTVFLTGLSGAGKSTLAKILYVKLMQLQDRPVTLLDGDIVRKNLSNELTFSREHRDINIRRIGFVASEITKNGGVAICAPIAPYTETRRHVREMISGFGGFIEVHLCTPLSVCERRDRKGLYAKARAGLVKGVTGIDDPYEAPTDAEVSIDTSQTGPGDAVQALLDHLAGQGFIHTPASNKTTTA
jgi:sulfate adenylyltransferase